MITARDCLPMQQSPFKEAAMNQIKFDENKINSMRDHMQKLMQTLQKNKEQVPAELLNTKYKKGYFSLISNLKQLSSDYAGFLVLHDIRIHSDYLDEVTALIKQRIDTTGILPQLSAAVFQKYDIIQFETLAASLRIQIKDELECFYGHCCCLFFSEECLEDPTILPEIYCPVNGCIWLDGKWLPAKNVEKVFLENT